MPASPASYGGLCRVLGSGLAPRRDLQLRGIGGGSTAPQRCSTTLTAKPRASTTLPHAPGDMRHAFELYMTGRGGVPPWVSWGRHNRPLYTGGLKTREIYSPTVLEVESRVGRTTLPPDVLGEAGAFLPLPFSGGSRYPLHLLSSLCLCAQPLSPFSVRTLNLKPPRSQLIYLHLQRPI